MYTLYMHIEIQSFLDARRTLVYAVGGTSPGIVEELRSREGALSGMDAGYTTVNDGKYRGHLYHVGQDEFVAADSWPSNC